MCSNEPINRAGKVCGDSLDLKSPGCALPGLSMSDKQGFEFLIVP